jgi:hypothetical protein
MVVKEIQCKKAGSKQNICPEIPIELQARKLVRVFWANKLIALIIIELIPTKYNITCIQPIFRIPTLVRLVRRIKRAA